jgi:RNA polymerase sigma factor (sigma-70 family)
VLNESELLSEAHSSPADPMSARNRRETNPKTAGVRRARADEPVEMPAPEAPRASAETGANARALDARDAVTRSDGVYERVAPVVERTLRFYAAADPERDDIAQDALIAILRNRDTVADPVQLEAWAARVTFNTLCSVFRRRKIRRWLPLEALQGADPEAPASDFENREILARVMRILEQLPGEERTMLTLELLGSGSQEDIARQCGCSKRTVRRRLKGARRRFMILANADPMLRSRARAAEQSGREDGAGS